MPRGRLLKLALIVSLSVAVVGGIVLWGLPAMIRWFAISQIATHTGRATTIDDVRLNPFTGRLSVRRLRLAERDGAQTFVEVPRLEMRFVPSALWRSHIRLADVSLVAPVARVVRAKSGELNVSDLVSALTRPAGSPSRWAVTVDRLAISNGTVHAHDEAVTPSSTWSVRTLDLELLELTTRAGAKPGSGTVRGRIDEATLDLTVERLRLDPLAAIVQIALHGFELRRLGPYMSHAGARYRVHGGRLAAALSATVDHKGEELTKAALSGTVSVENETVARAGHDETFLDIPRAAIHVKEADAMTRSLSLSSVVIEGATLRARRDRQGVIDIFDIFRQAARDDVGPRVSGAAPAPTVSRRLVAAVGSLAHGFDRIHIERILLGPSTVTLVDESVTPLTTLSLSRMQTTIRDFTWPATHAAALTLSAMLPGGGTIEITGLLGLQPFEAQLATVVRDAPIDPYQAYMPGAARFRGRVS